jgi:hypothetical protein
MGYTSGVDRAICFNGAKSVELGTHDFLNSSFFEFSFSRNSILPIPFDHVYHDTNTNIGWYDDRVATISPHFGDEFSGRLIGVNDYADSTSSDTLVVEIKNSDSSVDSLFVMYNKAEGLNENTSEAIDKVIITQGAAGGQSWKLAEITPGQTWTSSNYFLDKTLSIATSTEASEGNVQYVTTTIKFANTACTDDSQCTTDLQNYNCLSEQCVSSVCKIISQDGCCGNGVCDATEYCDTCGDCLNSSDHCNSFVASWSNVSTSSGIYGISFDVTVTKDVYFHEISDVFVWQSGTYTAKVYTREGTNTSENDLNNWVQVYSGSIAASNVSGRSYITSIPFTSRVSTSSGGTRAFYVDVTETGSTPQFKIPYETNNNPVSNSDMSMSSATTRRQSSGTTIGAARTDVGTFIGTLKYGYEKNTSPTSAPSRSPSALDDDQQCVDSLSTFKKIRKNGKINIRDCEWIKAKPEKLNRRCQKESNASHCPETCQQCANFDCKDSTRKFMYIRDGKDDKEIDCAWLKKKPTKLAKRCEKDIFKTTCRETCSFVNDLIDCSV